MGTVYELRIFSNLFIYYYLKKLLMFIFIFERETERGQGRDRERETHNLQQPPGSELAAQSPTWGSNSRTLRS